MKYVATAMIQMVIDADNIISAKKMAMCCDGIIDNVSIVGPILPEELIYSMEKEDINVEEKGDKE